MNPAIDLPAILAAHAAWLARGRVGDGRADLSGAVLTGAELTCADLRGADLRGTGVVRIYGRYESTLYPGDDLAYGCERRPLSSWTPERCRELAERHDPEALPDLLATVAYCRALREGGAL